MIPENLTATAPKKISGAQAMTAARTWATNAEARDLLFEMLRVPVGSDADKTHHDKLVAMFTSAKKNEAGEVVSLQPFAGTIVEDVDAPLVARFALADALQFALISGFAVDPSRLAW